MASLSKMALEHTRELLPLTGTLPEFLDPIHFCWKDHCRGHFFSTIHSGSEGLGPGEPFFSLAVVGRGPPTLDQWKRTNGSVVQWLPFSNFFLVAAPLKWSKPKKGFPFFPRVTEQLRWKLPFETLLWEPEGNQILTIGRRRF